MVINKIQFLSLFLLLSFGLTAFGISASDKTDGFLTKPSFVPENAKYFDLINKTFTLNPDELALLKQNGFLVSDRLAFTDFKTAYAYIYWKDLPVVVTTDSILHAIHKTYDELLSRLESTILTSKLTELLTHSRQQLKKDADANKDSALNELYSDLEIYLTVPLALLAVQKTYSDETQQELFPDTQGIKPYLELAKAANTVDDITLFGSDQKVDFTLFKPRGHYTKSERLKRYFRAMSWLASIDFRFVDYLHYNPRLNLKHIAAAVLLRDTINKAKQRSTWQEFDDLFSAFVGRSDNITLPDLERFLVDAGIESPSHIIHHPNPEQLQKLLTTNDYGLQRITGQILSGASYNEGPVSRPITFKLLGQRFVVDAYIMSNLVYDRLMVDGEKVKRPLPSPLDVMYVLGNNRALTHLQGELAQYGYQDNLNALRISVENSESVFWTNNVYNLWLNALRQLDINTTDKVYPQTMRTTAWADKMLHTQLASWAQLRHDNILYAKHSFSSRPLCEYPSGYVEPYPKFYGVIGEYAHMGQMLFNKLSTNQLTEDEQDIRQIILTYFADLKYITTRLQIMAEKELRLETFNQEEENFLKDIVVRKSKRERDCGEPLYQETGWYMKLFPWYDYWEDDKEILLIADIHTSPNEDPEYINLYPTRVLHIGTGPVATQIFTVDTDEGSTMYVGPAFTYYEVIEEGFPPVRLTDEIWKKRLHTEPRPLPPSWTKRFRLPITGKIQYLELPKEATEFEEEFQAIPEELQRQDTEIEKIEKKLQQIPEPEWQDTPLPENTDEKGWWERVKELF